MLVEVEVPSFDVPNKNDLTLILEDIAGCIQDVDSVDPYPVKMWGQYQVECAALEFSFLRTSLEVVKIRP